MWTQFWNVPIKDEEKIVLIEATLTVAIAFLTKLLPNVRYISDEDLITLHFNETKKKNCMIFTDSSLLGLTAVERNCLSWSPKDYWDLDYLLAFKKEKVKIKKPDRFMSLKNYLKQSKIKIYYKADVDAILENTEGK